MPDLKIVSNAGPLISLCSINQLNLLKKLFGSIFIPGAVHREIVTHGEGRPGSREVSEAEWIKKRDVGENAMLGLMLDKLDAGESESIILASQLKADYIILDEKLARRKVGRIELPVIGTLGVLLMAKKAGHIQNVSTLLIELEKASFRVNKEVKSMIIKKAGEIHYQSPIPNHIITQK